MNLKIFCCGFVVICCARLSFAQIASPIPVETAAFKTLLIDPCSTSLAGGKANLTTKPLTRQADTYVGDYQLKVTPYFFKSEKGNISIVFSDESLHQIVLGKPVKFTGTSTSRPSGKIRAIIGVATPSANDRGFVTFSIKTDNGVLVFTSPYKVLDN